MIEATLTRAPPIWLAMSPYTLVEATTRIAPPVVSGVGAEHPARAIAAAAAVAKRSGNFTRMVEPSKKWLMISVINNPSGRFRSPDERFSGDSGAESEIGANLDPKWAADAASLRRNARWGGSRGRGPDADPSRGEEPVLR